MDVSGFFVHAFARENQCSDCMHALSNPKPCVLSYNMALFSAPTMPKPYER